MYTHKFTVKEKNGSRILISDFSIDAHELEEENKLKELVLSQYRKVLKGGSIELTYTGGFSTE